MTIYAVFREGVYRHECVGVFSSQEKAEDAARAVVAVERDDWHSYRVHPFELDAAGAFEPGPYEYADSVAEPDAVSEFKKARQVTGAFCHTTDAFCPAVAR